MGVPVTQVGDSTSARFRIKTDEGSPIKTTENAPAPIQTPVSRLVRTIPATPATKPMISEITIQTADGKTRYRLGHEIEEETGEGSREYCRCDHGGIKVECKTKS